MSVLIFAGYSRRFLIRKLSNCITLDIRRSGARSVRVLWFMHHMGGGWLSIQDLRSIGAGQWKALQYAIPDLVKDDLVDQIQLTRKNGQPYLRYKINSSGKRLLDAVEQHVQHEYDKAVGRTTAFRQQHGIQKLVT